MSKETSSKLKIAFSRVIARYIQALFLFKKFGVVHNNVFAGIHIVNPTQKPTYSKQNVDLTDNLLDYALALNDTKDLKKFADKSKDQEVITDYKNRSKYKAELEAELLKSKNSTITSYIQEINAIEDWAQSKELSYWTFSKIKITRELINAIGTIALYTVLLGQKNLFPAIPKNKLSSSPFSTLIAKYNCILKNIPGNQHQRSLTILFNLSMSSQVPDDQLDLYIDLECKLPSLATIPYREFKTKGIPQKSIQKEIFTKLKPIHKQYFHNARNLGYNPIVIHENVFTSIFIFFKRAFWFSKKLPKPIRDVFAKRLVFLREKWVIKKKFKHLP